MRTQKLLAGAALVLFGAGCTTAEQDASSDDITPDFSAKRISGIARLTIQKTAGADSVILDERDLDIKSVRSAKGDSLGFNIGPAKEFLGSPLAIALPANSDTVVIEYQTSPDAAAVQWLSAEQ